VLGAILFCGAVATTIGAIFVYKTKVDNNAAPILTGLQTTAGLYVTVTAKRTSLQFNGISTAEAYIYPRGGPSSSADGALAFDAMVIQRSPDVVITYTLLNDRAYRSKADASSGAVTLVECLHASQVPPVHLVASSLTDSSVVDQVQGAPFKSCADGKLLSLTFAGEAFVFCNSADNKLQHAASDDLDVVFQYLSDPTAMPELVAPGDADCPVVVAPSPIAPPSTTSYVQTASAIYRAATGPTRAATINKSSCGCASVKKPCLFVHGIGVKDAGPMTDSSDYFGSIHEHAPCCSSTKFVKFDTVTQGWTDPSLQTAFCKAALSVSKSTSKTTVGPLILVTHSMGNLIAGGAVASGLCDFSADVSWMSLAGPMEGSKTTNALEEKCGQSGVIDGTFANILGWSGFCPSPRAYVQLKHETTVGSDMQAKYERAINVRATHGAHLLCGTSPYGLTTTMSVPLQILGSISHHDNPTHDSVVDIDSCMAGYGSYGFGSDTSNFHYLASINHLDATFRNGDGWWGSDRKAQKWFECAL
ncbi:hypothetical protein As57867_009532, partial [Aphanomyces stellatus]